MDNHTENNDELMGHDGMTPDSDDDLTVEEALEDIGTKIIDGTSDEQRLFQIVEFCDSINQVYEDFEDLDGDFYISVKMKERAKVIGLEMGHWDPTYHPDGFVDFADYGEPADLKFNIMKIESLTFHC